MLCYNIGIWIDTTVYDPNSYFCNPGKIIIFLSSSMFCKNIYLLTFQCYYKCSFRSLICTNIYFLYCFRFLLQLWKKRNSKNSSVINLFCLVLLSFEINISMKSYKEGFTICYLQIKTQSKSVNEERGSPFKNACDFSVF